MKKRYIQCLLAALFLSGLNSLSALQTAPWFGNDKEFELRLGQRYQQAKKLPLKYKDNDDKREHFVSKVSLAISPISTWSSEIEVNLAEVKDRDSFSLSNTKLSARRLLYNDLVGDPASLTVGFSCCFPKMKNLTDAFDVPYSDVNGELHASIGREIAHRSSYSSRFYALLAYGVKSRGPSWGRLKLNYEKNFRDKHRLEVFTHACSSLGRGDRLASYSSDRQFAQGHFHFIDAGVVLHNVVDFVGEWSLSFKRRIHAKYLPSQSYEVSLALMIPFFP
ncbi:MAG: hypothetical protein L7U87_07340 [Chlamydiales bacterium]|nr:hypothetical protein [Chlamydiales bacterium]